MRHAPNETTQSCLFSVILSHLIVTMHMHIICSDLNWDEIIITVLLNIQLMFHIILTTLIISYFFYIFIFYSLFPMIGED